MTDVDSWLEWRRNGVGASDVAAAAIGLYGGIYGAVASKHGHTSTWNQDRKDVGHAWEDRIADAVHTLTGYWVVGEQQLCEHPDQPHRRATVDGFLAATPEIFDMADVHSLLELKVRHPNAGQDNPRAYRLAQVQYQMHVTGMTRALVAVATVDSADTLVSLELEWVDADSERQLFLADLADRIWRHVQDGTYPNPDTPESLEYVKARFADTDDDDEPVDLEDIVDLIARHKELKTAVKAADDETRIVEARIREALGQRRRGVAPGWGVTLSAPTRVLTDTAADAFLQVHPECGRTVIDRKKAETVDKPLLDELKEPVGARVLRINRKRQS